MPVTHSFKYEANTEKYKTDALAREYLKGFHQYLGQCLRNREDMEFKTDSINFLQLNLKLKLPVIHQLNQA
jgi:hypothetical protein